MPFELKINGLSGLLCTVKADHSWNVRDLKLAIKEAVDIRFAEQTLFYGEEELKDFMFQNMDGSAEVTLVRNMQEHSAAQFIADGGYQIAKRIIGGGRFGAVHRGADHFYGRNVAIKVFAESAAPQFLHEVDLLKSLHEPVSPQGFTQIYYYGTGDVGDSKYLVMELLGRSLDDVRQNNYGRLSVETVAVLAEQVICRIEYLHSKGIVHRDIKPQDFLFGLNNKMQQLYLIDFGLSSRYWSKTHVPMQSHVRFTGTPAYASINALRGIQQSRRDDLESIGYMLIELLRGQLPWRAAHMANRNMLESRILQKKDQVPLSKLCEGFPDEFQQYLSYVRDLGYQCRPDYLLLQKLFRDIREQHGIYEQPFQSSKVFSECCMRSVDGPLDPLVIPSDIAQPDDKPSASSSMQTSACHVM